jgi:hypothetical protein
MGIFLKKAILSIKIDFLDIITNKEYKNFLVSLVSKEYFVNLEYLRSLLFKKNVEDFYYSL